MKTLVLAIAAAAAITPVAAQQARPFPATPVPCNTAGWTTCAVSFDGATVTRTFVHPRGGRTTQTNAGCTATPTKISCPAGSYTTDGGFSGAAAPLSVMLNKAGRPTGTGH